MEKLINKILNENETILKEIKPNKKRFLTIKMIISYIINGVFALLCFAMSILFYIKKDSVKYLVVLMAGCLFFIFLALFIHFYLKKTYNNSLYYITNFRFIIITGFCSPKIKSVNFSDVDSLNVYTNALDNFKNQYSTGNIEFGTPSSPITIDKGNDVFTFKSVDNPYDLYKEILSLVKKDIN